MDRDDAGEADDGPAGLVAVAAIDRVGIHALDHRLVERGPEHADRQAVVEDDLAGGEPDKDLLPLLGGDAVERVAVGLAAMGVGGGDPRTIELRRRQRQLVTLAWG